MFSADTLPKGSKGGNDANMLERLFETLNFGGKPEEFELLETERGEPGFFGGWREHDGSKRTTEPEEPEIPDTLDGCLFRLKEEFRLDINPDVILRPFMLGGRMRALAVFINGMADGKNVNDFVLREGMREGCLDGLTGDLATYLIGHVFTVNEAKRGTSWDGARRAILDGNTIVFLDGSSSCVIMDTRGYEHRGISEARHEQVIKGPQEGFTENLRSNITLIRRILRMQDLVCEFRSCGGENGLTAGLLYREGVTNITLVDEVKRRLAAVDTSEVINMGTLEQLTEKHAFFPFPQLLSTERPDRAAHFLMQGHVVVLLDGSPFASIMPTTLFTLMSTAEDASLRAPQGSVIKLVRYFGALVSLVLPGGFLALALHHPGLLSTEVLHTIAASRQMVLTPMGVELLFLLVIFQLIREAGLRVPGGIGQSVGIIGGVVLGQAAISANLVSSAVLIVVALSGLGNFCIPDYETQLAASYIRTLLVLCSWVGGLLGLTCGIVCIVAFTVTTKSYGVPFLAPFTPKTYSKKPILVRGRTTSHKKASDFINTRREAN